MTKLKVFIFLILLSIAMISVAIVVLPYHTYYLALNEGINNSYIELPRFQDKYYLGKRYQSLDLNKEKIINNKQWRNFPFEDFKVPIPYENSLFVVIPDFRFIDRGQRIGFSLFSNQNKFYFNFMLGGVQKFKLDYQSDWVFRLPYFNKYIRKKTSLELWDDILTKNIVFPKRGDLGFFSYLKKVSMLDLHEMIYNVFILKSRKMFFPENMISFGQYKNKNMAIIEVESSSGGSKLEKIMLYREGQLYSYYLESSLNFNISNYLRWNFIENIDFEGHTPDKAIGIYALFRKLSFKDKTSQQGMLHLYSCWSLDQNRKEFMKEMIQYLERGPNSNLVYLKPLYRFALKKYKTTYSLREERLLETQEMKKSRLQEEALRDQEKKSKSNVIDRFESRAEEAAHYLQKAKDHRRDSQKSRFTKDEPEEEGVMEID